MEMNKVLRAYRQLVRTRDKQLEKRKQAKQQVRAAEEAVSLIQQVAIGVQTTIHEKLAVIVSHCLESVFGTKYRFQIRFRRKRNKTSAEIYLIDEKSGEELDTNNTVGGGIIDVAAFAMRLAVVIMAKPEPRKVLILDEPLKFVSVEYRENARMMMEAVAKEMGVQVIMITHDKELISGEVIEINE